MGETPTSGFSLRKKSYHGEGGVSWSLWTAHPNFLNPHLRICLLILEREKGEEGEGEKHWLVTSHTCPDWGSNQQAFGEWDDTPPNWATPTFFLKTTSQGLGTVAGINAIVKDLRLQGWWSLSYLHLILQSGHAETMGSRVTIENSTRW